MPKHKSRSGGFGNLNFGYLNLFRISIFGFRIFFIITLTSLILNAVFIYQSYKRNVVARVVDGDSFDLLDGRRIRLLGLDAPERGECRGQEAYERLKNLAQGRHVRLKNVVTDDYGRLLANVFISYNTLDLLAGGARSGSPKIGVPLRVDFGAVERQDPQITNFVNQIMVSEGLARFNSVNTEYKEILKKAQEKAKTEKLGIWSETCRSEKPTTQCVIKANIRAGKKTYFLPDCSNYSDVIIDLSFGDRWFCTQEEAKSSGFSKAPGC